MNYDILTIQAWVRALYDANVGQGAGNQLWIEPYGYPMTFAGFVGTTGNATQILAINANADFVLTKISYHANIGAAQNVGNKTVAFVRALLTDTGSARPFFNAAVDLENLAANDFPGHPLSYPRWLAANTTVSVQLTGYATAAETYGIELLFEGLTVRQYSQPMQAAR